jgi:thioredoxin type arsenate reductase
MLTRLASITAPPFLKLLADDVRWKLVATLSRSDRRVQELVEEVGEPPNLVSYHLGKLRALEIVAERRSGADRRAVYYHLDLERLRDALLATGEKLHPGILPGMSDENVDTKDGLARPVRVLFLCTHNSARSQMAEGILRALGGSNVSVQSAGTEATRVHPLAMREMAKRSIDISGHRSKVLDEFLGQSFDYVITVCDNARESCPVFPGAPERIHWSIADPSAVEGTEAAKQRAFAKAADELTTRIRYLLALFTRRDH